LKYGDYLAKYWVARFQAATAHSFQLSEVLALQSVTSVPARSLELEHRIGYVRPGYDADIVVWNLHPLLVGATPLQVYIDGNPTLDPKKVEESLSKMQNQNYGGDQLPKMRMELTEETKKEICDKAAGEGESLIITGIKKSFLGSTEAESRTTQDLTMVLESGKIACFGVHEVCASRHKDSRTIRLENGYVLPGLTALSSNLGLSEIIGESSTTDGLVSGDAADPDSVVYAKYGVHLEGKAFKRARIGGVTKALSVPMLDGGLQAGVSVGIRTSGKKTILSGGIFQDDVALHFLIGQEVKGKCKSAPRS
jgi:imidazolonepropionase-like amidohydrolase